MAIEANGIKLFEAFPGWRRLPLDEIKVTKSLEQDRVWGSTPQISPSSQFSPQHQINSEVVTNHDGPLTPIMKEG